MEMETGMEICFDEAAVTYFDQKPLETIPKRWLYYVRCFRGIVKHFGLILGHFLVIDTAIFIL